MTAANHAKRLACKIAVNAVAVALVLVSVPTADSRCATAQDALQMKHESNTVTSTSSAEEVRIVAKVGSHVVTVGELQRRLSLVPAFQRSTLGATDDEIKRAFLQKVLIPERLFVLAATQKGKHKDREVQAKQREILKSALMMKMREQLKQQPTITPEQVAAYYQENIHKYHSPERVSVWRIVVADKQTAEKLIAQSKQDPTPATWNGLARAYSLDASTSMRGGNLGFVTREGISSDGKTRISQQVALAAFAARDGEIVSKPVPEGSGFAVVWRRGAMPAVNHSLNEVRTSIIEILTRERVRTTFQELTNGLWEKYVRVFDNNASRLVDVTTGGDLKLEGKPGRIPHGQQSGTTRSAPSPSPRGLR